MSYLFPSSLQYRYENCFVFNRDGNKIGPIRIHRYRMDGLKNPDINCNAGIKMKDKVISALRARYKYLTGQEQTGNSIVIPQSKKDGWYPGLPLSLDRSAIVRAFYGKASPVEIEWAIQIAVSSKVIGDTVESIHKMTRECIGLDCNGFVGNFTKAIGKVNADGHYGPSTPTTRYAQRGIKRESYSEIVEHDVLIWDDPRHIAIVDTNLRSDGWLRVTESASSLGGLGSRWYQATGRTEKRKKTVDGGGPGTMIQFRRPTKNGGMKSCYLLVCKIC